MFLAHTKAGTPVWRIKYRYGGAERLYSVGPYPEITLETARAEREAVRAQVREGIDPVQARVIRRTERIASSAETFEAVAGEWFEKNKRFWSDVHYEKARQAFGPTIALELRVWQKRIGSKGYVFPGNVVLRQFSD